METEMNRFVHRILKSSTASSIGGTAKSSPTQQLVQTELQNAKLLYFGEFHSEARIVSFQTELIKEWSKCLASSYSSSSLVAGRSSTGTDMPQPRLHLIMEHFSVDMQDMLHRFAGGVAPYEGQSFADDDEEALLALMSSYKNDFGTEGHDLHPYRDLLQFCRQTTRGSVQQEQQYCPVHIHGGFIPRNHAARLNKECPDIASKQSFFDEMSNQRGYLPKHGDAMYTGLFEGNDGLNNYKLRGSREHRLLIESLMTGADLYSPSEIETHVEEGATGEEDNESPLPRLLQAQLLKDHAMGYRVASLMLQHYENSGGMHSLSSDRYIIIAGFGHLKHYLGVPECVKRYLRQEALLHPSEHRRSAAMDLLLSVSCSPPHPAGDNNYNMKFGGSGASLIGCQMMYEAYLEDSYPPMIEAAIGASEGDDDADDSIDEHVKRNLLKQLYLTKPKLMDEYILKSQEVSGPFLQYANGIAGFAHPCADYLFVYDEDDDNTIDDSDMIAEADVESNNTCPFHNQSNDGSINNSDGAKGETMKAYEQVGNTAYMRGNVTRARAIMSQLGYTTDDMNYIGDDDIYNFQGVANPHSVAKIQVGESVLDIGSGLGIDSFIAMRHCGAEKHRPEAVDEDEDARLPFVVGVDLAQSEVNHSMKRALARGYNVPKCIQFIRGDVEKLEEALLTKNMSMGTFDVCISNGAFCLVPNKVKAFTNVFQALKSGGRMAISTTTIVSKSLDPSFEWPVCMRMFANLDSIQDMCESIGFKNVNVIDAESPMEGMELPVDYENNEGATSNGDGAPAGNRQRFKIHGRYADQYEFLEKMDMDELCRVITVYGEKP
jgi:SAM-dependent methyltransferase